MLKREQVEAFWADRVAKIDTVADPCHYMDYWMDRYTWETRTVALDKLKCLKRANSLVDIGCGVGLYTRSMFLHNMSDDGVAVGFDRPEFALAAQARGVDWTGLTFKPGLVPSPEIEAAVAEADVVTLLTVWDFMSIEDRYTLSNYFRKMKSGSSVVMIDIMTNKVPWHQQDLTYKYVDEWEVKRVTMDICGFEIEQTIPVSYANMRVFHKLGKNATAFYLSKMWDSLPFIQPQVSCVSWIKVA